MQHLTHKIYQAMVERGIHADGLIEWRLGEYQRLCDMDKYKRNRDIYVLISLSGRGAYFGSMSDPDKKGYVRLNDAPLSRKEREEIKRIKREKLLLQRKAAERCQKFWQELSRPANPDHPYLVRKQIPAQYCREYYHPKYNHSYLLIPAYNRHKQLCGLQFIPAHADEDKRFLAGSVLSGSYLLLGERVTPIVRFVEGFATGMSVYLATGDLTVVCFNAGNIANVIVSLSHWLKDQSWVICCDRDEAGWRYASRALEIIRTELVFKDATIISPLFPPSRIQGSAKTPEIITDFNDIHTVYGLEAVEGQMYRHLLTKQCAESLR